MTRAHDFGRLAEAAAARLLEQRGWSILHRNWRWRHKEIDLVARRKDTIAFIEVRARRSDRCGHPLETISRQKRRDLQLAARAWITAHGRPAWTYRFDAVSVLLRRDAVDIDHVEDAWRL